MLSTFSRNTWTPPRWHDRVIKIICPAKRRVNFFPNAHIYRGAKRSGDLPRHVLRRRIVSTLYILNCTLSPGGDEFVGWMGGCVLVCVCACVCVYVYVYLCVCTCSSYTYTTVYVHIYARTLSNYFHPPSGCWQIDFVTRGRDGSIYTERGVI